MFEYTRRQHNHSRNYAESEGQSYHKTRVSATDRHAYVSYGTKYDSQPCGIPLGASHRAGKGQCADRRIEKSVGNGLISPIYCLTLTCRTNSTVCVRVSCIWTKSPFPLGSHFGRAVTAGDWEGHPMSHNPAISVVRKIAKPSRKTWDPPTKVVYSKRKAQKEGYYA